MKWKKEEFQDKDAVPEVTDSLCLIPSLEKLFFEDIGILLTNKSNIHLMLLGYE